jgi:hypothetical protein
MATQNAMIKGLIGIKLNTSRLWRCLVFAITHFESIGILAASCFAYKGRRAF